MSRLLQDRDQIKLRNQNNLRENKLSYSNSKHKQITAHSPVLSRWSKESKHQRQKSKVTDESKESTKI